MGRTANSFETRDAVSDSETVRRRAVVAASRGLSPFVAVAVALLVASKPLAPVGARERA